MDRSNEFDRVWKETVYQTLYDDSDEQILSYLREMQHQGGNNNQRRRPRRVINCNREDEHLRLMNDYFSENSVYTENQFRRRFRMRRHLFNRIVNALSNHDEYFQLRPDAVGRMGLSPLQKCTAAIRILAYGSPADCVDEYIRIGECTATQCLQKFLRGVIEIFGEEYLRKPNNNDINRLLQIGAARGFPGMLGSIDCMHWEWKNYPVACQGQFRRGDHRKPTIILEAIASQDLWIWHAFFGVAGSNNDINVLNQSPVFDEVLQGRAPPVQFSINGTPYNMGYCLADGIYPNWATFMKTIPMPQGPKRKLFSKCQEAVRKDVERAFGVLKSRFAIICGPSRSWNMDTMKDIMLACIILHNMIVEDERDTFGGNVDVDYDHVDNDISNVEVSRGAPPDFATYLQTRRVMHTREIHQQLQADLVEHIWKYFGHENDEN